ncbi:LysR family transcriptional regulator [Celeribacter ethanolicus]|uniref:LysR family transcriptional regulator n=1 Tax=Celeribacter ethanolicus TaxID=1758178 RepID=UPI0008306C55|nr:LysR family transcriptional regulator [Celeribacter ethanolicus]
MNRPLPPLYALRAFEAAARTGSATGAAAELNVTQSAVSKHIKTLEAHFGRKLFHRHGPRLEVTPQGQIFAEGLKHGFKQIEDACRVFQSERNVLRIKAPSTLTMRWLLDSVSRFRAGAPGFDVQISSVWMDIDTVDFFTEPYDCAILLGSGQFGSGTRSAKLFDEWLIPICAPSMSRDLGRDLGKYDLIHPSPDRRDWRRWLGRTGMSEQADISQGQVFDTLEQGNAAAMAGHGLSIGDLVLTSSALSGGQLVAPFPKAVRTGDGYFMVWAESCRKRRYVQRFLEFLEGDVPVCRKPELTFLD